jgi:hypothetical protein
MSTNTPISISIFLLNRAVTAVIGCEGVCPTLTNMMTVFLTAAVLTAAPAADAFAFSGGVSHVVTHPAAVTTMPVTRSTTGTRPRDICQRHRRYRTPAATLVNPSLVVINRIEASWEENAILQGPFDRLLQA